MILLLVNPMANNGKALKEAEQVSAALKERGKEHILRQSRPGEIALQCREGVETGMEAIYLVAGDGTIAECAEALQGSGVPLGILPCGTGNDFARALGIPLDPMEALALILRGKTRRVDLIAWEDGGGSGGMVVNALGCGIDVEVLLRRERMRHLGKLSYIAALLGTALRYTGQIMRYSWEGKEGEGKTLLLFAANGQSIGGGIALAPRAVVDDGLMDIVYIKGLTRLRLWSLLPRVLNASFLDAPEVHYTRAAQWHLPGAYTCEMDGEIRDIENVRLRVLPGALSVFTP